MWFNYSISWRYFHYRGFATGISARWLSSSPRTFRECESRRLRLGPHHFIEQFLNLFRICTKLISMQSLLCMCKCGTAARVLEMDMLMRCRWKDRLADTSGKQVAGERKQPPNTSRETINHHISISYQAIKTPSHTGRLTVSFRWFATLKGSTSQMNFCEAQDLWTVRRGPHIL